MNVTTFTYLFYISWSQFPADIASGRIAEVRSRSMSCNCMTRTSQQNAEALDNAAVITDRELSCIPQRIPEFSH